MNTLNESKYVVIDGNRVEISDEVDKYLRNTQDNMRIKQHRHNECNCPRANHLKCTTDCETCKYRVYINVSLDAPAFSDDEGNVEEVLYPQMKSNYTSFEDLIADRDEAKAVLAYVHDSAPELITFASLKVNGYTNSEIAQKLGIKRSTLDSRRAKLRKEIKEIFPDFSL